MAESSKLQLFVKASDDGETIGHCPFCQRLFMILLLKGVPFTLTTVDIKRSLDVLKDFAPGAQLPILLYDGEPKTDTLKIEEFLEETLGPPSFPSLEPRYKESTVAGNDIFHRFSAYIKNPAPAQDEALQKKLLKALLKLDRYLNTPLEYELARDPKLTVSRRRFLDGDQLTLADCGLLPKLNIVNVVCQHYRQAGIPKELRGVWRYLEVAAEVKEFKYTCPNGLLGCGQTTQGMPQSCSLGCLEDAGAALPFCLRQGRPATATSGGFRTDCRTWLRWWHP